MTDEANKLREESSQLQQKLIEAVSKADDLNKENELLRNREGKEEELGWIGEMREILNLLELYKSEITRLEGELVEKSKISSRFQEIKEQ